MVSAVRRSWIAELLSRPVVAMEYVGSQVELPIHPEEAALVERSVRKRRHEFAAGRLCARAALAELGITRFPLLADARRAPVWPADVVGSITHADGFCAAAVATDSVFAGIGIDAECRGRVGCDLWNDLFVDEERAWLEALPPSESADMATVLFSAKESFYKCQYALTRAWLGFHDVHVAIGEDVFTLTLIEPRPGLPKTSIGRFRLVGPHAITAIGIDAGRAPR